MLRVHTEPKEKKAKTVPTTAKKDNKEHKDKIDQKRECDFVPPDHRLPTCYLFIVPVRVEILIREYDRPKDEKLK